jgi:hypothetical protein
MLENQWRTIMAICARCGTWNQDSITACANCGTKIAPVTAGAGPATQPPSGYAGAGEPTAGSDVLAKRRRKYILCAAVLTVSTVAGVLLAKSANGKYDSSTQCTLDSNYTVETTTKNGSVESVRYAVTYRFDVNSKQYTGHVKLASEPTVSEFTVYYMAADPQENGLSQSRTIKAYVAACIIAFLIAIIAYALLPRKQPITLGMATQSNAPGVGDSGNEHLRMKHGKYSAWGYVHVAFFVQAFLVAPLIALVLAAVSHADATGNAIISTAVFAAIASTLWVYTDRWNCIEAFSSRFCSGVANLSVFYVPAISLVYANIRGLKKLIGR